MVLFLTQSRILHSLAVLTLGRDRRFTELGVFLSEIWHFEIETFRELNFGPSD